MDVRYPSNESSKPLAPEKKLLKRDLEAILSKAKAASRRDWTFFMVAAQTGLRLCEVLHLRAEDMDGDGLVITRRKRRKPFREIASFPDQVMKLLSEWSKSQKIERGFLFEGNSNPCFLRGAKICGGGHVSRRDIQRRWTGYVKGAGIYKRGRGIHCLRHYFCTEAYRQTKDLKFVKDMVGHSSITVTDRYAHTVDLREELKS